MTLRGTAGLSGSKVRNSLKRNGQTERKNTSDPHKSEKNLKPQVCFQEGPQGRLEPSYPQDGERGPTRFEFSLVRVKGSGKNRQGARLGGKICVRKRELSRVLVKERDNWKEEEKGIKSTMEKASNSPGERTNLLLIRRAFFISEAREERAGSKRRKGRYPFRVETEEKARTQEPGRGKNLTDFECGKRGRKIVTRKGEGGKKRGRLNRRLIVACLRPLKEGNSGPWDFLK